jgi:DNA mismatch repair ATPase MutS
VAGKERRGLEVLRSWGLGVLAPGDASSGQIVALRDNALVKMTPMLRQYLELKDQAGSALLLYRMGDFYELFFEDAQTAAPVLGITLTRRRHNDDVDAPMCGVPHHAFDGYIGKLLDAGFRVAVAEQVEDPGDRKGSRPAGNRPDPHPGHDLGDRSPRWVEEVLPGGIWRR